MATTKSSTVLFMLGLICIFVVVQGSVAEATSTLRQEGLIAASADIVTKPLLYARRLLKVEPAKKREVKATMNATEVSARASSSR